MSTVVNEVRRGTYLDSVALMRISGAIRSMDGVDECGLMMGTPANLRILADAGVLAAEGETAGPGDLVIAIRARDAAHAAAAVTEAARILSRPKRTSGSGPAAVMPRTLRSAVAALPGANLALVSVPGAFAATEAMKALASGLNVLLFSDNVGLDDEIALKTEARARGLLMMGPDCGTAIIGGVPLAFANAVTRGDTGIIGASGTGIQEVSCLVSNGGGGISHAIGTGGRDLSREVGAITTLTALDLLDADPATRQIVLISKPPAPEVARTVLARVARSPKRVVVCFIGAKQLDLPPNAVAAATLEDAANLSLGRPVAALSSRSGPASSRHPAATPASLSLPSASGKLHGLFSGGTLAAEAQLILSRAGLAVASNAPVAGSVSMAEGQGRHTILDLGDDAYTIGRPHPMIEPAVRDAHIRAALESPDCAVVLLDCVLGYGSHSDPAGHIARLVETRPPGGPRIVASVTGTDADPQQRALQVERLRTAGIEVPPSNASATRRAVEALAQATSPERG